MTPRRHSTDDTQEWGARPWWYGLARIILENQGLTGLLLTVLLAFCMWFGTKTVDQNAIFQKGQTETNTILRESSVRQESELKMTNEAIKSLKEQQAIDHAHVKEKLDTLIGRQSLVRQTGSLSLS